LRLVLGICERPGVFGFLQINQLLSGSGGVGGGFSAPAEIWIFDGDLPGVPFTTSLNPSRK
jgi:hypothetical protein